MNPLICLIVEDDLDDQEIFMLAMREMADKFLCVFANNGFDALDRLQRQEIRPDYVFLDLNMPRLNGLQCLEEIRKFPHMSEVPVVIFSTSSEKKFIDQALQLGASAFITKPPSITHLTKALKDFFYSYGNSNKS